MPTDMTNTSEQVVNPKTQNPMDKAKLKEEIKRKKRNNEFKSRLEVTKSFRKRLIANWSLSIDYRRNKPTMSQGDQDQVAVPMDWAMTKTKEALLFSQVPQVRVSHPMASSQAGPWLASFETKLNDTLVASGIESAMAEAMPDCINAAGLGIVMVSLETLTVDKEVPAVDLSLLPPEAQKAALQSGEIGGVKIPMKVVPQQLDRRYLVQRISPSDFLWPLEFVGSNFDNAPWVGRSGRITWAEAVQRFKLKEEDKHKVIGDDRTHQDKLSYDMEKERSVPEDKVTFDEIFYKTHQYDPEAQSYSTIHHLVFVNGIEKPVIDEPWQGQKINEQDGTVLGALKFPIRVLTLAYISDDAIPPSDSAIGRGQVDELNKSRTQILWQRFRNIPFRWADVNRVDPVIMQSLMRGTWQNIIPVQGDGSRIIGEVADAAQKQDNYQFDSIAKADLAETWSIGANQMGSGADIETKGESQEVSRGLQTRITRERARVASHVVGIAEVLGGLLCIFEDPQSFGEDFDPQFSKNLAFSILADSTVILDSQQRLERLDRFLNTYAKSGFVALEPVLREIATLSGLDPNVVIKAPDPQSPPPPNVSLRLSGQEDMMNPLMLAIYLAEGKPPTEEHIKKAMELIQMAVSVPGMVQPGMPPQQPQGGVGPDGQPLPQGPAPTPVGEANPDLTVLPKIAKRSDDPAAGGKEPV